MSPIPAGSGRSSANDGAWNTALQSYILPPLIGLPFNDMVQNGEGARHAGSPKYVRLIIVHGVFMAIPFLFLIPAAIYIARFRKRSEPRKAIQSHFLLQIASILFVTVGFLAGYYAVTKGAWGSNPHHLIGGILYGCLILQAFWGFIVRQVEKSKIRKMGEVGLMSMVHAWFGRGLWLLGLAQIPLGLYVYGAPLPFFVIYAIITFLLFFSYFVLEYHMNKRLAKYQSSRLSTQRNGQYNPVSQSEMSQVHTETAPPTTFDPDAPTSLDRQQDEQLDRSVTVLNNNEVQTPNTTRFNRLNRLSLSIGNRFRRRVSSTESRMPGGTITTPLSIDSSRPPTESTHYQSGLHPPPSRQRPNILPIAVSRPIATVGNLDQHHFRRNGEEDPLSEPPSNIGNRNRVPEPAASTSLSPVSPVSPVSSPQLQIPNTAQESSDVSSLTSSQDRNRYYRPGLSTGNMITSPLVSRSLSDEDEDSDLRYYGAPTNPPKVPLPVPPEAARRHLHRREPSSDVSTSTVPDAVVRIPLSRLGEDGPVELPAGMLVSGNPSGESPQVSVQVKVDRLGRSVTVRRLPEEEAALARQAKARERAAKAAEKEKEIQEIQKEKARREARERERQKEEREKERVSGNMPRTSAESRYGRDKTQPQSLGEILASAREREMGGSAGKSDVTDTGGGAGGSRVGSVVSTAMTDDVEAEERIRERRRKMRRQERKDAGSAGYYGARDGARNIEWT